jgi:hypothetical protein
MVTRRVTLKPGQKKTVKVPGPIRKVTITTKPR